MLIDRAIGKNDAKHAANMLNVSLGSDAPPPPILRLNN